MRQGWLGGYPERNKAIVLTVTPNNRFEVVAVHPAYVHLLAWEGTPKFVKTDELLEKACVQVSKETVD